MVVEFDHVVFGSLAMKPRKYNTFLNKLTNDLKSSLIFIPFLLSRLNSHLNDPPPHVGNWNYLSVLCGSCSFVSHQFINDFEG